jgi:hypothetical protein
MTAVDGKIASGADDDAANANATRDRARDVTPNDNGTNRTAAAAHQHGSETPRSNPAADRADQQNPRNLQLGAGPRPARLPPAALLAPLLAPLLETPALRSHAATLPIVLAALVVAARDNASPAAADSRGPTSWPDTFDNSASDATVWLADGTTRYSNALGDTSDETAARTPSGDNAAADAQDLTLVSDRLRTHTQTSPQESLTPWVKSRRRACTPPPRRSTSRCGQHNDGTKAKPSKLRVAAAHRPRRRTPHQ